jgi:hypothetical protein
VAGSQRQTILDDSTSETVEAREKYIIGKNQIRYRGDFSRELFENALIRIPVEREFGHAEVVLREVASPSADADHF